MSRPAFLILLAIVAIVPARPLAGTERPNILFICTDDLRPMLGCYGAEWMHTPHIDALAARGTLFERAYCQAAQCGPSRVSFMTGLRPETTEVFSLRDRFDFSESNLGAALTLPRYLRSKGYHTVSFGKIYHDGRDDPESWSVPASPGRDGEILEIVIDEGAPSVIAPREDCPAWQAPDVADDHLYAGRMTTKVAATIGALAEEQQPFFLAVGYRRPHLPFVAPKRYFDLYSGDDAPWLLPDPEHADVPRDAPWQGFYNSTNYAPAPGRGSRWATPPPLRPSDFGEARQFAGYELRSYRGVPARGRIDDELTRELRRAYMACVSYVDAQVGRLLEALRTSGLDGDTIVVLLSDHGWHLGEHATWSKMTNYEWATRVPLIVSAPGIHRGQSARCRALVELVDLYPTLCDLAGLPIPAHLEGRSLVPLLEDPSSAGWKTAAFSQYPRKQGEMGLSVRSDAFRYVEWRSPKGSEVVARELYDHRVDPAEMRNLTGDPAMAEVIDELAGQLPAAATQ